MPRLTRKQRAWGAKAKLDRLAAPALRELRLNLSNVRALLNPQGSFSEVRSEQSTLKSEHEVAEEHLAEGQQDEPEPECGKVRLELEAVPQVAPNNVSPHSAEAAKARQWKRWESAFRRLQQQGEVHTDVLLKGLELAGFTILRPEWVTEVVSEITRYNSLDMEEFMRMIQMYEARQYSEFAVVFEHFDIDKNGRLEAEELAALLENCNITALDQVLKEILVEVAPLDSDHLTVEEFKRVVEIIHVNEGFSSREIMRLKEVFRKFDLDRGGFLDCRELHKAMAWLGYGLTNEEVEQISNSCDVGGKGQLEEHEFFGFMRKVKEREIGLVKKALSRQRPDGNNVYMQKQLDRVLRTLGYIPNAQAIRDAAEDAGIIRANPAEEVELSGHGLQPWKSNVAGRRTSLAGSNSRRSSCASGRRLSASRRDSASTVGHHTASFHDLPEKLAVPKTINLSNFFSFLEVYRHREGLDRSQIMELDAAFNKYDRSGYGEIDMKDVGKVLRWMGYTASFNVQLMLIKEVDIDESGTLDIVEARKLVRKFQEKELTAWTATFHSAVSATSRKYLEVETCVHTLRSLGIKATVEQVEEIRQELAVRLQVNKQRRFSTILPSPTIDLMPAKSVLLKPSQEEADESSSSFADASSSSEEESEPEVTMCSQASGHEFTDKIDLAVFHLICAKLVAQAKEASRDNAGYTLDECQRMRETFAKYDVNKSGDIDNYEMSKLVQDLCPDLATNMAKRAEITRILSEVAPPKHGSFDFPDFLRLMRQVDDMQDRIRMAKESFAIEKTNFSSREVEEFRRLFLGEEDMNGSFRGMLRIDEFLSLLAPVLGTSPARQELTRLFFDIDSHMHPDHAQKVVAPMSPKGSLGGHHYKAQPVNKPRIALDFPEFLILMHLVLEKNVCQVKEHCKTILECGRRFSHRPSRLH